MLKSEEKFYIGISLGFNASACLVSNKQGVLAAISQERLSNVKNTKEIPIDAVLKCCWLAGVKKVERVIFSFYQQLTMKDFDRYMPEKYRSLYESVKKSANATSDSIIPVMLKKLGIEVENDSSMVRIFHHTAHEYSAFGVYGKEEKYVSITGDGFGDGLSMRIKFVDENGERILYQQLTRNSLALVYQFVTGALGFKMHQHEGKITGLAAYGIPLYEKCFESLFVEDEKHLYRFDEKVYEQTDAYVLTDDDKKLIADNTAIEDFEGFLRLKKSVFFLVNHLQSMGAKMEDIAASVQMFVEKMLMKIITNKVAPFLKQQGNEKVACYLAGGLFANVKLNMLVKDMGLFSDVYVSPAMGDEGTCVGAVLSYLTSVFADYDCNVAKRREIVDNILVGSYMPLNTDTANKLVENHKDVKCINVGNLTDLVDKISTALADKKIVCLCQSRMEFGPRALCHRSILYDCSEKEVNTWLNEQLGRTEFMPFAPVCLEENLDKLFVNVEPGRQSARFMTMAMECKEEFVSKYPAACHIDNTARPQIVNKNTDVLMSMILESYEKKTGKEVLINTSFNIHNYPIIENAEIAIDSWLKSNTDVLVINDKMFFREREK